MRASRLPIVARVNGHALAGGFGLMLACDLVVAAEGAEIGTPEINLGLWPFMITTVIQRDLPRKIALELMLTGQAHARGRGRALGLREPGRARRANSMPRWTSSSQTAQVEEPADRGARQALVLPGRGHGVLEMRSSTSPGC